jgi:hypothetical protein
MHFLHAVDAAGIKENPLAQRGLARVNVSRNPDIPDPAQTLHGYSSSAAAKFARNNAPRLFACTAACGRQTAYPFEYHRYLGEG